MWRYVPSVCDITGNNGKRKELLTEHLMRSFFGQFLALYQHGRGHAAVVALIKFQNLNCIVSQKVMQDLSREDKHCKKAGIKNCVFI